MEIVIKNTGEWESDEWETYTRAFNEVFLKTKTRSDFKQKYFDTTDGYAYHALLKDDQQVVGGCTVIPYDYLLNDSGFRVGLAVDVFILARYRDDPYALYRMYNSLKKKLLARGIDLVVAVPNDVSRPYWKNVVKWKDVGRLHYHVLPVRLGNVISKWRGVLNPVSMIGTKMLLGLASIIRSAEKPACIRINREKKIIEKQRYTAGHKQVSLQNAVFAYRVMNEEGIRTCYLIDFYHPEKRKKDVHSLRKAIRYICKNEQVDLIIFIGKLSFFQVLLFKVPYRSEPRHLFLMADVVNASKVENKVIINPENWDFGLFNYDVR